MNRSRGRVETCPYITSLPHSFGFVQDRQLAPVIEELAKEYKGKAKIGKLDTEENNSTPAKFGITAIPTIIVFKSGQAVNKMVGVKSKKDLKVALDAQLE